MPDNFPLFYQFHFYLFGLVAIVAALTFVTRKSPVAAVLWLVVTMFCLAVEYILLDAQFIGIMQILVYAGAIMVVFLFVIMLLNLGHPSEIADVRGIGAKLLGAFVGIVMLAELGFLWRVGLPAVRYAVPAGYADNQFAKYGVVGAVAKPLYQDYSLAFELTSVLLLVAIAGAVVIGRRKEVAVEGGAHPEGALSLTAPLRVRSRSPLGGDAALDDADIVSNSSSNGAH